MNQTEFKTQIFRAPAQWQSGLAFGLEPLPNGGFTIFSRPTFADWLPPTSFFNARPLSLALDECEQVYWIDAKDFRLYRFDPKSQTVERMTGLSKCGADATEVRQPVRMMLDRFNLWLLDKGKRRLLVFARENLQLKRELGRGLEPIDFALDLRGQVYVLDHCTPEIHTFKTQSLLPHGEPFGKEYLKKPVGLALGKEHRIYVIDALSNHFLLFDQNGKYLCALGDFRKISTHFQPALIASNHKGNLFVLDGNEKHLHEFAPDGGYLGEIHLPAGITTITGLNFDRRDHLYLATDKGLAHFSNQLNFVGQTGYYYTRTLDHGNEQWQWHRLALEAELPPGTIFEIFYHTSDSESLRNAVDRTIADSEFSEQAKRARLESLLSTKWIGPKKNPHDMLLRENHGRFLWVKLELSTFNEREKPKIHALRAYYPRLSYLRYLPAVYQENAVSRAFLERFLSLFESVLHGLEQEITALFKHFDPQLAPPAFLDWLASWMNLALEEEWKVERKRRFILQAATLFKQKGTPAGLAALVEFYVGKKPLLLEHARALKPLLLGTEVRLGFNSVVNRTPVRGFRLGESAILGRTAIREVAQRPEDPFLPLAHRFTLLLDLNREEFQRYERKLGQALEEETPSHTAYSIRLIGETNLGPEIFIGVNSRVAEYQPLQIGAATAILGRTVAVANGEPATRLERDSKIDRNIRLL